MSFWNNGFFRGSDAPGCRFWHHPILPQIAVREANAGGCLRSAARADAPAKLLAGACLSGYISLSRVPGNLPRLQTNWISTWSKGSEGCGPTKSCETEMLASVVKP